MRNPTKTQRFWRSNKNLGYEKCDKSKQQQQAVESVSSRLGQREGRFSRLEDKIGKLPYSDINKEKKPSVVIHAYNLSSLRSWTRRITQVMLWLCKILSQNNKYRVGNAAH